MFKVGYFISHEVLDILYLIFAKDNEYYGLMRVGGSGAQSFDFSEEFYSLYAVERNCFLITDIFRDAFEGNI